MIKSLLYEGYGYNTKNSKTRRKKLEDRYTYDQVKNKDAYFGVLAPNVILIDVDYMDQAENLLKALKAKGVNCPVMKTTKGMHFYFKDTRGAYKNRVTHWYTAGGTIIDTQLASSNGMAYLKKPGEIKEREFIYGTDLTELEELPYILYPYRKTITDTFTNEATGEKKKVGEITALFDDLGEGSRNTGLHGHILALQNAGFKDRDIIREIIRDINYFISSDPLDEAELELIVRDEAFDKGEKENFFTEFFSDTGKFYHAKFGDYIIEKYKIILYDDELYYFDDMKSKYILLENSDSLERLFTQEIRELKRNQRLEVRSYIKLSAPKKYPPPYNLIAFVNGIFDILTGTYKVPDTDYLFFNVIPWRYNPFVGKSEFIENYLDSLTCGDKNLVKVLLEFIGFCFYRNNSLRKSIFITGGKYNGKSKFYSLLEILLGEDNVYMGMSLERLNGRFDLVNLRNKLLTVCDDVDGNYIKDTSILKKVISGDAITLEEKGKQAKAFKYYGKITLSANETPRFNDKTGALASRFTVVPFKNKFEPGSPECDPLIEEKFNSQENIEYLIILALTALKEVLKRKGFTTTEETIESLKEFRKENNPILEFIEVQKETKGEEFYLDVPCGKIYSEYIDYCLNNSIPHTTTNSFGRLLKGELELKSIVNKVDGKAIRFYIKK